MAQAADYRVTLKYGATSAPYSASKPHKGRDRGCPTGTPLIVAGTQIGLTGETGFTIGAHLHTQEWINGYANTREPQNEFQAGVVVNIDPTGTQGDGSFGKFITIQTADGWNDTYCHLSRIDVKIGQVIGGAMTQSEAEKVVTYLYRLGTGNYPTQGQAEYWVPRVKNTPTGIDELGNAMLGSQQAYNTDERTNAVFKSYLQKQATKSELDYWRGRPMFQLDDSAASTRFNKDAGTIEELKKQLADGGNLPAGTYLKINKEDVKEVI